LFIFRAGKKIVSASARSSFSEVMARVCPEHALPPCVRDPVGPYPAIAKQVLKNIRQDTGRPVEHPVWGWQEACRISIHAALRDLHSRRRLTADCDSTRGLQRSADCRLRTVTLAGGMTVIRAFSRARAYKGADWTNATQRLWRTTTNIKSMGPNAKVAWTWAIRSKRRPPIRSEQTTPGGEMGNIVKRPAHAMVRSAATTCSCLIYTAFPVALLGFARLLGANEYRQPGQTEVPGCAPSGGRTESRHVGPAA
jgi:hypothetical protein